jgi:Cu(I)/Ag(I) efflux system membrane protein CusA/SilA
MVGGMISSTILTLLVIPAIYALWRESALGRAEEGSKAGFAGTTREALG